MQKAVMRSHDRPWLAGYAGVAAAVGWTALVLQFILEMHQSLAGDEGALAGIATYFSYFTILTNILVAVTLTSRLLFRPRVVTDFFRKPVVICAITVSIIIVAIVYSLLLRHLGNPRGLSLVADVLLHDVMPALFLAYWWLTVAPGAVLWRDLPYWLLYPFAYFLYVLLRGIFTGIYPYPFIDVSKLGYPQALLTAAAVMAGFATAGVLLLLLLNVRRWWPEWKPTS